MQAFLVLDDNEGSRFVIRSVLEHAGYKVFEAGTAVRATELQREERRLGLVVADALLDTESGAAVVRRLREHQPDLPVLFVSGYPLDQLKARGLIGDDDLREGWTGFLQKPFSAKTLVQEVRNLLSRL